MTAAAILSFFHLLHGQLSFLHNLVVNLHDKNLGMTLDAFLVVPGCVFFMTENSSAFPVASDRVISSGKDPHLTILSIACSFFFPPFLLAASALVDDSVRLSHCPFSLGDSLCASALAFLREFLILPSQDIHLVSRAQPLHS